jgi:catechol 1,2-dioxygenase
MAKDVYYFTEKNSVEVVLSRIVDPRNARLAEVMTSVIKHLHAVVKEVEPTYEEWEAAIEFLTATGQMSDDRRQEFILLSDVLGVSMLVDAINTRRPSGATENTVLGPFHVSGVPNRQLGDTISEDGLGVPLYVHGRVSDPSGKPVAGAIVDTWQASHDGFYDNQKPDEKPEHNLRGIFRTDENGAFWYRAVKPSYYGIPNDGPVGKMLECLGRDNMRPAHLHYIVSAPGYETITTHLFDSKSKFLENDAVFGVKESLIRDFEQIDDPEKAASIKMENPFWSVEANFVLSPLS